jgi:general stress protein CsbA
MTLKQLVIKINDYLLYFGFGAICITSVLLGATAGPLYAAGFGLIALIVFSILSGFWFAVSEIASNSQRQVILQEKQNKLIEKLNHNLDAHINNQFGDL